MKRPGYLIQYLKLILLLIFGLIGVLIIIYGLVGFVNHTTQVGARGGWLEETYEYAKIGACIGVGVATVGYSMEKIQKIIRHLK